jgi:capsule polysaccharide modification protein KpsS
MSLQVYSTCTEKEYKRELYDKTLEISVGGSVFYFNIPKNPMVYTSESKGVLYINSSSYWEPLIYMLEDIKNEFAYNVDALAHSLGKSIDLKKDEFLGLDDIKKVEKRKYYLRISNIEIGFYYNIYLPYGRNGFIEIIPYFKKI